MMANGRGQLGYTLTLVLGLVAGITACDTTGSGNKKPVVMDAGKMQGPITCASTQDCGGTGVCVSGLCQDVTSCSSDADCSANGQVCHAQRFFCVECDGRSGQCGQGKTCQFDFTCVDINTGTDAGSQDGAASACMGSCTDRTMCANDQVCRAGECCPPPSRCRSPADCPASAPMCNGATGECFGGDSCVNDMDCDGRAGCPAGACFCDIGAAPPGTCKPRPDECASDMDCYQNGMYAGKYCSLGSSPRRCLDSPNCTSDQDCAQLGLVCDLTQGSPTQGRCINGVMCTMDSECGATQVCRNNVCAAATCVEKPSICNSQTEMCDTTTGRCVPNQSGACMSHTDCQQGYYCNTAVNPARCDQGCRDNSDCPMGTCNAQHMCEYGTGALCAPCNADSDCPSGTRCADVLGMKTCREPCLISGCTMNPNATCVLLFCSCII